MGKPAVAIELHMILDNVSSHKTQAIRNWLARRPHWHVHFTPAGASSIVEIAHSFAGAEG